MHRICCTCCGMQAALERLFDDFPSDMHLIFLLTGTLYERICQAHGTELCPSAAAVDACCSPVRRLYNPLAHCSLAQSAPAPLLQRTPTARHVQALIKQVRTRAGTGVLLVSRQEVVAADLIWRNRLHWRWHQLLLLCSEPAGVDVQ